MWAPFVLSLVAVVAVRTTARSHRYSNGRKLNQIDHNPEWQKYFASPVASPVHSHSVLRSSEKDPDLEGPGHARIVAPEIESVITQALAAEDNHAASSSSSSSSSSKKGKHKSKGKGGQAAESEYDDDFFDHYNGSEPGEDDDDDNHSKSYKSKGLKKKSSKTRGDKEDCYYVNGIYIGKDCDEGKKRCNEKLKRGISNRLDLTTLATLLYFHSKFHPDEVSCTKKRNLRLLHHLIKPLRQ